MTATTYWIGKRFVAEWTLVDPATSAAVTDATVAGTITLPDLSTAAMTLDHAVDTNVYRLSYEATTAGLHAYRLEASVSFVDVDEGTFTVRRSLVGAEPITVDPATAIGQVRLLCTDLNETAPLFTDAHISAFLTMEGSNVRLAAAQALDTIASSEALVSKKIRTSSGLSTDGPAVAKELRERADSLRKQAAQFDANGDLFAGEVIDFDPSSWWLDSE